MALYPSYVNVLQMTINLFSPLPNIMSQTGSPVFVISADDSGGYSGSGRSPSWYPCMSRCREAGFFAAGHESAFGISVNSRDDLNRLRDFVKQDMARYFEQYKSMITEDVKKYDFVIATDGSGDTCIDIDLFKEYLSELSKHMPFGTGFDAPLIELKFHSKQADWQIIGKERQHLKIGLDCGFNVLCWHQANMAYLKDTDSIIIVTGKLEKNVFNNMTSVQFMMSYGGVIEYVLLEDSQVA